MNNNSNGKGDSPRNNFSKNFSKNYDLINWKKAKPQKKNKKKNKQ